MQTTEIVRVSLADILSLGDIPGVPGTAMRDIDEKNVAHLVNSNEYEQWPPVTLYDVPGRGLVMTDGYHRKEARYRLAALTYIEQTMNAAIRDEKERQQEQAIANLPADVQDRLRRESEIKAEIRPYENDREIFKAALVANTRHGKGLKSPVNQALDYYLLTRDETPAPSQSSVALLFGIARASLNEYVKRNEKAQEKAAKEEGKEAPTDEPVQSEDVKKGLRLVKGLAALIEKDAEDMIEPLLALMPVFVTGLCGAYAVTDETEIKAAFRQAIGSDRQALSDVEQVQRWLLAAITPDPVPSRQEKNKAKKAALKKSLDAAPDTFRQTDITKQIEDAASEAAVQA